jgi:hypothetical protein
MLEWLVVATERSVIEDIRKAPDSVLSFKDAIEEVSKVRPNPSPRCSTN